MAASRGEALSSARPGDQGGPAVNARRRLTYALLGSLLIHAGVLSLSAAGRGLGLPGFELPWRDRRLEAPAMRVVPMPMPVPVPAPAPVATPSRVEPVVTPDALSTVSGSRAAEQRSVPAVPSPATPSERPSTEATSVTAAATGSLPKMDDAGALDGAAAPLTVAPMTALAPQTAPAPAPAPAPESPSAAIIALWQSDLPTWTVPKASTVPMLQPLIAPTVVASSGSAATHTDATPTVRTAVDRTQGSAEAASQARAAEAALRERTRLADARQLAEQLASATKEAARVEAARQEAIREDAVRREADRQRLARQEAARAEASRAEAANVEAARAESARAEASRAEASRLEASRAEASRVEATRAEATRAEAARAESARAEAALADAARAESSRAEAARADAARADAARAQTAREDLQRREAARRALGRQMDEEADRRDAAAPASRPSSTLPYSLSSARRGRLFGRIDANAELVLYAEAWARKIQLNMSVERVREAAKRPHTDPLVTVALRRDGTVESVTFVLSSGVPEIDESIRQIIQSQAPYSAFPPALARDYDVIELRRTWYFDSAVRLY